MNLVLFPFDSWLRVHPLCGLGRAGRAHTRQASQGSCAPGCWEVLAVTHKSTVFVLNFLSPPLVFPEAWNLKVNNWGLSLKAVSKEWKSTGTSSKSDSGTWQTHIR